MRRSLIDTKDKQGRGGRRNKGVSRVDLNQGNNSPSPNRMQPVVRSNSPRSSSFRFIIPKPSAIVMDLLGVLVCRSFMTSSKEFRDYFQHNVLEYLNDSWRQKQLKVMINFFRCSQASVPDEYKLADRDEPREEQIKQARKHVIWRLRNDPTNSALSLFMLGMTEWGYRTKTLQTSVYDEIPLVLKAWKDHYQIPLYVGVGSADFLILILQNTTFGNLLPLFSGHMNIMDFDGTRANKDFKKLSTLLRLPPERILYLTRFRQDCKRALENGLQSIIVLRSDFDSHGLIASLKSKREASTSLDGTKILKPTAEEMSPPPQARAGFQIPDLKNSEVKKQFENNMSSLSLIDDHEDVDRYGNQSSQIFEQDIGKYSMILSLSEINFK